jgi:DNA-binding PadR family transcriptional regulator
MLVVLAIFISAFMVYRDLLQHVLLETYCTPIQQTYNKQKERKNKMINVQKEVQTTLTKDLLDLTILQLLNTHPMHGYEIITTIRKSFSVYLGPNTVYPLLNGLEKKRNIKSEWNMNYEQPRKVYQLTNDGKAVLDFTANSLTIIGKPIGTDSKKCLVLNRSKFRSVLFAVEKKGFLPNLCSLTKINIKHITKLFHSQSL